MSNWLKICDLAKYFFPFFSIGTYFLLVLGLLDGSVLQVYMKIWSKQMLLL